MTGLDYFIDSILLVLIWYSELKSDLDWDLDLADSNLI